MTENGEELLEKLFLLAPGLISLRAAALKGRDPTCADETLCCILKLCKEKNPKEILEVGCAEGLTSIAMLLFCEGKVTAIEKDGERARRAEQNFKNFHLEERVRLFEGDAGDILPCLEKKFDLIFLDGPKVQYKNYFPYLKELLREGGVLLSDDVLFLHWDREPPPPKRRMLIEHLKEYVKLLKEDSDFETKILPIGEGLAVSVKKRDTGCNFR